MNLWQFRKLGKLKLLSKFVKNCFRLYFRDDKVVKIKRGPLKGFFWVCSTQHQFWMPLGMYEKETSAWLKSQLREGMTFIDIGANAGYFTLLGSSCVSKVIAFEPIPQNISQIQKHLLANNINNVVLENMAISDTTGQVSFVIEENNANSHLSEIYIQHADTKPLQTININSVRLDDYVKCNLLTPNVIKIDVEGAEIKVLNGARETFIKYKPVCIISTHSKQLCDECISFFADNGYEVDRLKGFEHELLCFPSGER
jgi:FkbM family methyltransferase